MAESRYRKFLKILGPGVVTGASDNDPAGISTYSVAGASTGYSLLWLSIVTLPLVIAIQQMCAKIGLTKKEGLTEVIKQNYGWPLAIISAITLIITNVATIGADLAGIAAGINLLAPAVKISYIVPVVAAGLAFVEVFASYKTIERYLKWVLLILFTYIIAGFYSHPDWTRALKSTFIPSFQVNKTTLTAIVAVLGTTISPYLFFWQASQEVEEVKAEKLERVSRQEYVYRMFEVAVGFFFANVVFFFIILTTAATLNKKGITSIETARQAAEALAPIAGQASQHLFAIGLIASGILAVPVLAGSTAYVIAELFGWREGLDQKLRSAPGFYAILAVSILIGIGIDLFHISPIIALYYSQVLDGLVVPILLVVIMLIANNKRILQDRTNGVYMNIFGGLAIVTMTLAVVLFLYLQFK